MFNGDIDGLQKPMGPPTADRIQVEWYSAKELCGMTGMPGTDRAIQLKAKRESWKSRKRQGRGGGMEYHISSFPAETRDFLLNAAVETLPVTADLPVLQAPAAPVPMEFSHLPEPAYLAKWQRDTMDSRCVILQYVNQVAEIHGLNKAIKRITAQARTETLPPHIQALIPVANARSGGAAGKQTLSVRTLYRWRELRAIGATALAPREPAKADVPAWVPYFLKCYRRPQKPSVPEAIDDLKLILPPGIDLPSESQCYRFLKKVSNVDRERGRRTGNDLRALLPFRRRDTSDLEPLEVVTCDGHTFKAKVQHPYHGRPFCPEVCAVIDCCTRKAIGWSAGLAESAETVADALRHAIQNTGIPLIFYTDPGSGNTALVNSHPAFGRYARMGIEFKTGQAGRTQARGLIERFQQSCWIKAAKKLGTFKGSSMDGHTLHKVTKLLDREVRQTGTSTRLPSWDDFIGLCLLAIDTYNARPHSSLPKITDETGRRRHMSPAEYWDHFIARGWHPERCTEAEVADMFRPREVKKTHRGEVRMFGNVYHHASLQHYTGQDVIVEYEPQDGSFVFVRDIEERLICVARFEHNKARYMPMSASEKAADNRAARRAKRLELQLEEVAMERNGSTVIDILTDPKVVAAREALKIEFQQAEAQRSAPEIAGAVPANDRDRWRLWQKLDAAVGAGESVADNLIKFHENWQKSAAWRAFYETERDLGGLREVK
jgi:putative transposase